MKTILLLLLFQYSEIFSSNITNSYSRQFVAMGSSFKITVVAKSSGEANQAIDFGIKEIERIEAMISSWDSGSQTSSINASAGIAPVKVDQELFKLVSRCILISELTDGAFDVTFGSGADHLFRFDPTKISSSNTRLSERLTDYKNIILSERDTTVFLPFEGMKIGFGAIGKGYAADKAKEVIMSLGTNSGVINAGGDLICWGKQSNLEEWTVAIADPVMKELPFSYMNITDKAVVTSGNYEKYADLKGKRYSHIIDPKSGRPVSGSISSVTILTESAEFADGLATAIFVLGKKAGMDLVNQLNGVECIIILSDKSILYSTGIDIQ